MLHYNAATTLDGFIASPDSSTSWIVPDSSIDFGALFAKYDYLLMGRKTYEVVVNFGSHVSDFAKDRVLVISTRLKQEEHPNVAIVQLQDVISLVNNLKVQGKDIWLMGGGQLAAPLFKARLVDRLDVAIMPALIGRGVRLIPEWQGDGWYKLDLERCEALRNSGIIMLEYSVRYD